MLTENNQIEIISMEKDVNFSSDKNKQTLVEGMQHQNINEINERSESDEDRSSPPLNMEQIRRQSFSGPLKASAMLV